MKKRILSLLLAVLMVLSILPAPTQAADVKTTADSGSVVGKFAKVTTFGYGEARQDPNYVGNMVTSDHYPELLVITGVAVVGSTTYYQLSAAEGYTWPAISNAADGWYLESTKVVVLEPCGICGKTDCTAIHFYCEICLKYDCGRDHLHCPACGEVDCAKAHTWCGLCGDYDCGIEHEDITPNTAPIIPDAPTMTEGAEVSIVDEYGDPVTEEGFLLLEGVKSSLSAWSALGENARYQWQIRYDSENDLWADIQGQRGKGILLSPAMVLSIIENQGCAAIRCTVTAGDETLTSAAIPVEVLNPGTMAAFALGSGTTEGDTSAAAEDDENKVNLIINYVFTDGKIAANPWAATLPAGVAYSTATPITVPTIAGYAPVIDESGNYQNATLNDYQLSLRFSAEDLTKDCEITIVYQPASVKVVVEHYQQNVDNDNYTLVDTEELSRVTGTAVDDVHKTYDGFYSLLYEHPTVAADGSTLIQVYYDRYYYLMKFELDGGYGVDPIYARYGAPIEIGTPIRAGYAFRGWLDVDGNAVVIPATMPEGGGTYTAKWDPQNTEYTVAYWIKDEGSNIYVGSQIVGAQSGTVVSGENDLTIQTNVCGMLQHTHGASCSMLCVLDEHAHGDGYCVYNCGIPYHDHTSGCNYICGETVHTTHTRTCYGFTSANVSANSTNITANNVYTTKDGLSIYRYRTSILSSWSYYVKIGNNYYQIFNYSSDTSLAHTMNCHIHDADCCSVEYHDHSDCTCNVVPHKHGAGCYSCGSLEHVHSDDCKSDLAEYVDFVEADQNVTVKGDGSTVVNVYYEYRTYTIRFIYAKKNGNSYQIAGLTRDGTLNNCWWTSGGTALPTFKDPSGKTERSTVVINGTTYYYISLTAKFGADISAIWPSANIGDAGSYEWGSWAAAAGTGYREKYGDAHANIVGPYPTMSADMIVDNPELLEDGTYLAQNMIAWWGSNQGIQPHAYHNFFEMLPGEEEVSGKTYTTYNGKRYRLEETYVFTAAHNGDTRVDPIYYNGFVCINDSRDTSNDTQENSNNYANNGNCGLCGNTCNYCNDFYYDRNMHKLYFWNYNSPLMEGTGSDVPYGASLALHGEYVDTEFMANPENYPDSLEPGAYQFAGWYTTADCLDGTEMDWTSTMPDSDMTVYAKWVPVSRTVRFFLDSADMRAETVIPDKMAALYAAAHGGAADANSPYEKFATRENVPNKSYIADVTTPGVSTGYENHPYSGYTFVGWFYQDENGNEKAFDPANMPVTQNLDLYGKWSSNVLCPYEIYFALDADGDGIADTKDGKIIYVADPITGSTLAGNSRTFDAKGDTALYANYQNGYFPNVASHTIDLKAQDDNNDGTQDTTTFTFLYTPSNPVPYTVRYLEAGTNNELADPITIEQNTKAVVTENFKPISGYMPDAYQKTLVVVPGGENVIIFYYTKDTEHALYQVNHYIANLGGGWTEYRSATFTGEIGKDYFASAETITGFTFSDDLTNQYNTADKINAYTNAPLPGVVSFSDTTDTVSGTLSGNGMQLNLYYTRNTYTYKVQYLEYGTNAVLHPEKTGTAGYNQFVSENAVTIQMDMDGDGKFEDFQLYEATNDPQTATIKDNNTVLTFYYVRCTAEELTVTKKVIGNPSENISFNFTLTSTATDFGGENAAYTYEIDGSKYTTAAENGVLSFSLKAGQTIKFFNLPTAKYTVTEQELPLGYYCDEPEHTVMLTKGAKVALTVTNEYAPAALAVKKVVNHVEEVTDNVTDFEFHITVPAGVTGPYSYTVGTEQKEATVVGGKLTITLRDGETALFANLPTGEYTVAEKDYTSQGYSATYEDTDDTTTDGKVKLDKGETETVTCTNAYPVGSLTITKTVNKAYANDEWTGDTFTFTVTRTDDVLKAGNSYPVYSGTTKIGDATVDENYQLVVTIAFAELGTKSIKIDNLPKGQYQVTEAGNPEYIQSALTVHTSISPEDYAGKAEFTNTYKKHLGDLTITKTVTALEGFTAPDVSFAFTVSGAALTKESYNISIDGASAVCQVINGKLTFQLKHGQTATIKDLALAEYTVTESVTDGFVLTASEGTSGTITADTVAAAAFENTYVPRGNLQVTKYIERGVYENIEIDAEQEFTFTLNLSYPLDKTETYTAKIYTADAEVPDQTISLTGKTLTFKLKHNQYIVIENLPTVAYTIEEAPVEGYWEPNFMDKESGVILAGGTTKIICYNPVELVPGDLQITKIIHDTTNNSSAPRHLPFEFTVSLNYITEPKNADGIYRVEYTCDPNKGTLVEIKDGDVVTGYRYTPNGGEGDELPATITIVPGMDMEHSFTLELYDGMTATVRDLPPSAYHVSEKDYSQDGFAASWTGNETGLLGGAVVNGNHPVEKLTCTNTYPLNTSGKLVIKKQVTKDYARDVLPADIFTFKVTPTDGNVLEGDYVVTISGVNVETIATTTTVTASRNSETGETYLLVEIPYTDAELVMDLNDSRTKTLTIEGLPLGMYAVEETVDEDYKQTQDTLKQSVYVGTNPGDAICINRYKRHLGNIQITKSLAEGSRDDGSDFLFHILDSENHVVMSVTLKAGETKTIWDLPVGTYTVMEDTAWNWRYELKTINDVPVAAGVSSTTADLNVNEIVAVTFTNEYRKNQWLNFFANWLNVFQKS